MLTLYQPRRVAITLVPSLRNAGGLKIRAIPTPPRGWFRENRREISLEPLSGQPPRDKVVSTGEPSRGVAPRRDRPTVGEGHQNIALLHRAARSARRSRHTHDGDVGGSHTFKGVEVTNSTRCYSVYVMVQCVWELIACAGLALLTDDFFQNAPRPLRGRSHPLNARADHSGVSARTGFAFASSCSLGRPGCRSDSPS